MNHTSGLPRLPGNMDMGKNPMQPYINYSLNNLYSYLTKAMPDTNKKVSYSNLGMGLAGVLAENISNNSYKQLLKKYITVPFKMKSTGLTTKENFLPIPVSRRGRGCTIKKRKPHLPLREKVRGNNLLNVITFFLGTPYKSFKMKSTGLNSKENLPVAVGYFNGAAAEYWDMNALKAAGGLKSNTSDMLTYLEYILKHPESKILESVTTVSATINNRINIAKGWHLLIESGKPEIIWHNGGTYGFSTFCAFDKVNRTTVFVAVNAFNVNAISDGLGIEIMKMMALEK